jgi:protein MBA1
MRRMNQEQMAQMMKAGTMLDHLGVIDGQYVKPTGANAPSWRSSPLARLSLEIRSRITALRLRCTSYYVRRWKISPPVPAPPTAEIIRATKALYEDIYTAFGNGDLAPVRDRLAPGFHDTLSQHIRERRPDTTRQWRLERYVGEPRVVSCIVGLLPNEAEAATAAKAKTGQAETAAAKAKAKKAAKEAAKAAKRDANGMLQAIVRIRSVQSLVTVARKRTWDRARRTTVEESVPLNQRGEEISAAGAEEVRKATARESVEYFVVQKKIRHSRVDPDWQAWGAAQESTPERIAYEAALRDARMEEQTRRQAAGEV